MDAGTPECFSAQGLCKSFFGVEVLHDVGFALRGGRVLGLVGENGSGKSTTMNIIGGVLPMDAGRMTLAGAEYRPRGPREAEAQGIAFIHQELNLFRNLSVAENLFIAGFPKRVAGLPFIDRAKVRVRTQELLAAVDLDIAPNTPVSRLSQGERQLVEIAKALGSNARIIIFDEPTTSLTTRETDRLFDIIGRLRRQGIAVIYISHILGDVMRLCDDIVVLRDGHLVGSAPRAEMTVERMISLMVGRTIDQMFPPRDPPVAIGAPVLEVRGVSQRGIVHDIGFSLRAGEVLGISGLMGAGRSELARILFGLDPHESGEVRICGEPVEDLSPAKCMAHGMAFLTEDRRAEGLMMEASIADNIALASLPAFGRTWARFIDRTRLGDEVTRVAAAVRINARDLVGTLVKNLSGGNQQKAVIGRWLLHRPRVFILDEPTRGIDVGAKYEVYKIINQLAADGTGVLFISSEIEELTGMCDRILVMAHGEIRAEFDRAAAGHDGFDREAMLRAAMWHGIKDAA
jgi:ABC-type sugar transport system ATPase subunit